MICRFFLSVLQRMETEKLFRPIRPQGPTWWMWLRQTRSTACYGFCFKNVLKKCITWCINKFSIHYLKHLEKTGKTMGKKVCKMPIKEHIRYWKLNVNKCEICFLKIIQNNVYYLTYTRFATMKYVQYLEYAYQNLKIM